VLFPSGFPTNNLYAFLFSPIRATWPAHLILRDCIIIIILGEEYCLIFRNKFIFYSEGLLASRPTPKSGGPPPVGCPLLLI
jgi:hypothetical protein